MANQTPNNKRPQQPQSGKSTVKRPQQGTNPQRRPDDENQSQGGWNQ